MTGIYKITCLVNNKSYIGQSVSIKRRWATHQRELANGIHYNQYLQKQDAFDFGTESTEFSKALENASKSTPLRDKNDPVGLGNFAEQIGRSLGSGLNAVNAAKIHSERLEEDLYFNTETYELFEDISYTKSYA